MISVMSSKRKTFSDSPGRSQDLVYNTTDEPVHECKQEERLREHDERLDYLEAGRKVDSKRIKDINTTVQSIWKAIKEGDDANTRYILLMVGVFVGAVVTLIGIVVAFVALIK